MILIIILVCAVLLKMLQSFIYQKYWNKDLSVTVNIKNTDCIAGEENILTETITNNKFLPLSRLHVKFSTPKSFLFENEENSSVSDYFYRDDLFSLFGHQCIKRHYKFISSKRGCFQIGDTSITSTDLFLSTIFTDKFTNNIIVNVYPKKTDISFFDIPFNTITGTYATSKTLIEDPFEFRGIRDYRPFDSMHNINWKASAKNDNLMVNTFFMTSSQSVHLLLNLDLNVYTRDERLLENIISLASSLAEKFILSGIPVSIQTNGKDIFSHDRLYCNEGSGRNHMVTIDTMLSRLDISSIPDDFIAIMDNNLTIANDNIYYIVISNKVSDDIINCYEAAKDSGVNSYFIVPELKSVEVNAQIRDMIKWDIEY